MKKINKTNLKKLRLEHNRVVKKEHKISPANQSNFDEWFVNNYNTYWYDDGSDPAFETHYVEISCYQTKSGNPYILEII